jgi:hypothetical protein
MSGGSFDYLYSKESLPADDLRAMAQALAVLSADEREGPLGPLASAARATALLALPHEHHLREVWKAVEWWQSHDIGRETMLRRIREAMGDGA